ncbi:MAG: 16S rRNA (uracil(1498)-N(3))-methyltransferase [Burkholderiaceae bacterium]
MPRIYCDLALSANGSFDLPQRAVKHIQVLRLQPGDEVTLFNGLGGEYICTIEQMGRQNVQAQTLQHLTLERENAQKIHLIVGMPANDRMDWLVEKATELGVQKITPLMTQRSVLKLQGERAIKKTQHWQLIAIGACEQSGRNRIPVIEEPITLGNLLQEQPSGEHRFVLSTHTLANQATLSSMDGKVIQVLSGPEGGLEPKEEDALVQRGFIPLSLGSRILRAETAAIKALIDFSQKA